MMASLAGSDIEPSGTVADGGLLCKLEKNERTNLFFLKEQELKMKIYKFKNSWKKLNKNKNWRQKITDLTIEKIYWTIWHSGWWGLTVQKAILFPQFQYFSLSVFVFVYVSTFVNKKLYLFLHLCYEELMKYFTGWVALW